MENYTNEGWDEVRVWFYENLLAGLESDPGRTTRQIFGSLFELGLSHLVEFTFSKRLLSMLICWSNHDQDTRQIWEEPESALAVNALLKTQTWKLKQPAEIAADSNFGYVHITGDSFFLFMFKRWDGLGFHEWRAFLEQCDEHDRRVYQLPTSNV